jgi:hypothetical protein
VRTWNVEGYAPLDEDDTLAQLSYVACSMMEEGKQQVSRGMLLHLLQRAHRELEAELQFGRISPEEFIERIEYRSSLLMQTGSELVDDVLQPVYEFRHLTFQEYLAARGYVEQQYPGRGSAEGLAVVLGRYFEDERWQEVIRLAAVLAGARAEELIRRLVADCSSGRDRERRIAQEPRSPLLIARCIQDEVKVTGPTLRSALEEIGRIPHMGAGITDLIEAILQGKFGKLFREVVEQKYLADFPKFHYADSFQMIIEKEYFADRKRAISKSIARELIDEFCSDDRKRKIRAALVTVELAFQTGRLERQGKSTKRKGLQETFRPLIGHVVTMLDSTDLPSAAAASWALAWLGASRMVREATPEMISRTFRVWQNAPSIHFAGWALTELPLLPRDSPVGEAWVDCDKFLETQLNGRHPIAALIIGWYRRSPWGDLELARHVQDNMLRPGDNNVATELLRNLGDVGLRALEELKSREVRVPVHAMNIGQESHDDR